MRLLLVLQILHVLLLFLLLQRPLVQELESHFRCGKMPLAISQRHCARHFSTLCFSTKSSSSKIPAAGAFISATSFISNCAKTHTTVTMSCALNSRDVSHAILDTAMNSASSFIATFAKAHAEFARLRGGFCPHGRDVRPEGVRGKWHEVAVGRRTGRSRNLDHEDNAVSLSGWSQR